MEKDKKDAGIDKKKLEELKKTCAEELSRVRHKLLVEQPFIGNVAMRFDIVPVRDKRCRTACTDYRNIYWDIAFLKSLSTEESVFVMAHEIWHAVQVHSCRRQTRDPELWNVAADMEINNILADDLNGRSVSVPPKLMFPPYKLKGKSAETIYDWLLKQAEKNNLNNALSKMDGPAQPRWGRNGDDSDGDSGDGPGGSGSKAKKKKNGQGEREKRDDSADGTKTGKLEGQFDRHCGDDEDEADGEEGSSSGPRDEWGEVGYDDDFRPKISQDAAERMREAAISAAQAYQREHGSLPAGVESIIDKLVKPEINWREYLCSFVSSIPNGRRTWLPPNRRYVHAEQYFQSRRSEAVNVTICIDTSGSCMGDLPKFFSEIKGLIETFPAYNIDVIQADAAVDKVDHYDQNDPIPFEYGETIEVCGGGGTDYGPAFEYIDENLQPDCVVYIGDGFASMSYDGPPSYPVLFIITKDGSFDFCDWGKKIRFKESSWD